MGRGGVRGKGEGVRGLWYPIVTPRPHNHPIVPRYHPIDAHNHLQHPITTPRCPMVTHRAP